MGIDVLATRLILPLASSVMGLQTYVFTIKVPEKTHTSAILYFSIANGKSIAGITSENFPYLNAEMC